MAKKKALQGQYYFSGRLLAQLAEISNHALTLVEAPSGFGKTTAVREYLNASLPEHACQKWHTCLGEATAWSGICALFGDAESNTAEEMLALGVPALESLPDLANLLRRHSCKSERYLVIDNYQLFDNSVPKKLVSALAACPDERLHIIVITQPLQDTGETTYHGYPYHHIGGRDLFFDNACIAKYCRLQSIRISTEGIERIQAIAGGWVAAIRLQLKHYKETGLFMGDRSIKTLVETAVLNKLGKAEQEFMMGAALLDSVTHRQATIINGGEPVSAGILDLLAPDFFIRHIADKNTQVIHSVLRDYLLERFTMQSRSFVETMRRRAAVACREEGDYFQAARFFRQVGDYDAILAMPFTDQYFFNRQEQDIIIFFSQVFQRCPAEILLRHPLTVMAVGIQFYKKGLRGQYAGIIQLMEGFLARPPGMPETQLYKIKGEFEMLLFFSKFNDVAKMGEHHKKAYEYLKHVSDPPCSGIYVGNLPWAVGAPSVISVYWNKSGGLQTALEAMDVCLPFYSQLAGGHGMGGEILMRAEACLARGDDVQAEMLCYKTLYTAENAGQTGNCLCAELLLARIFIVRGDEKAYSAARRNIARDMELARQTALTRLGEMCLAHLDMALGRTDELPEWLRRIESIRRTLYGVTQPHAVMLHSQMLLLEKRRAELYALTEPAMDTARAMNYSLLQTHHLIFLARAKMDEGRDKEAVDHLREALAIALPDCVYMPFAEQGDALLPLLEQITMAPKYKGMMEELTALCARHARGVKAIRALQDKGNSPLTPREKEVAALARERLSSQEIAAKLSVSANTAKTLLKSVYRKLGVNSKAQLKDADF